MAWTLCATPSLHGFHLLAVRRSYHLLKMWWEVRARQVEMGRGETPEQSTDLSSRHLGEYTYLPDGLMKQNFVFVSRDLKLYHK